MFERQSIYWYNLEATNKHNKPTHNMWPSTRIFWTFQHTRWFLLNFSSCLCKHSTGKNWTISPKCFMFYTKLVKGNSAGLVLIDMYVFPLYTKGHKDRLTMETQLKEVKRIVIFLGNSLESWCKETELQALHHPHLGLLRNAIQAFLLRSDWRYTISKEYIWSAKHTYVTALFSFG